jgi:hypothetical protein
MAEELGIEPTWSELAGTSPPEPPDPVDDTRGGRHRRHRAHIQSRDRTRYLPEGLAQDDVVARIESLLRERGIALTEVRQGQDMRSRGFLGTPQFFLGEEVFIGRQHLPLIRERLHGAPQAG